MHMFAPTFRYVWIRLDTFGYVWIRVWIFWIRLDTEYPKLLDTAPFWIRLDILDTFGYGAWSDGRVSKDIQNTVFGYVWIRRM